MTREEADALIARLRELGDGSLRAGLDRMFCEAKVCPKCLESWDNDACSCSCLNWQPPGHSAADHLTTTGPSQ